MTEFTYYIDLFGDTPDEITVTPEEEKRINEMAKEFSQFEHYSISKDGLSLTLINECLDDERVAEFSKKWGVRIVCTGHSDNSVYYETIWNNGELVKDAYADGYGGYSDSVTGENIEPDFGEPDPDDTVEAVDLYEFVEAYEAPAEPVELDELF